jgi:hypothetical protein
MLAQLKRANRRSIAFVWAMAVIFAIAPALSMALASPVGAFSRSFIHVHADDEPGHVHHGHHHHQHHDHDDSDHHHHGGTNDGPNPDQGQQRLHVHYDACCPSIVIPSQSGSALPHPLSGRIAILRVEPMQGAPPGQLLRPPILAS